MTITSNFQANLATLPATDAIDALELVSSAGAVVARLENRPGTAGSVRVYHALLKEFGEINQAAAQRGLEIYAEHVADARSNPGKHPNIDRLFPIADHAVPALQVSVFANVAG
jgi:hypothetical protein